MKKICILFLLLLFGFCNIFVAAETKGTSELVILHTNDHHGHPLKFYDNSAPDQGGLPGRASLVEMIRNQYPNVLVIDAGDFNTGRPESNFFKAQPDIQGYNFIGYDAVTLGNHEFDNPLEILQQQIQSAKFPILSANVKTKDGAYVGQPYIIKNFKGFKVAIFGLTTKEAELVASPQNIKDLIFEDEITIAKKLVPELKKKADIVIALVHLGVYNDEEQGSKRLAKYVPGIDLIVDGHSHTKLEAPIIINKTPIVQAYQWGLYLGKGIFTIKKKRIVDFKWELLPINVKVSVTKDDGTKELKYLTQEIPENQELLGLLTKYSDQVESELTKVIGHAETTFPNARVRYEETALGDLVADSMLWYTKNLNVDFAIQNGGGIRTDLPAGTITKKNIYEILPFDNSIAVVTLKGDQVQALFDFIATIPQGKGAFPQVSEGVSFTINYETNRCENILINGAPIDPDKIYKIATNSFMASGGDGYQAFTNALDYYDTSVFQRDAFIEYITNLNTALKPEVKGRITIIGTKIANYFKVLFKLAA